MTQAALSTETGVSAHRISEYERGKIDPSTNMLLRLLAGSGHTIALVDTAEGDFVNPYANARHLRNVLSLADALSAANRLS